MSQPTCQQATKNKRTISVMTKMTEESKRYLLQHRKLSHDRVDRLKKENVCCDRENYVAIGSRSWRT